MDLYALWPWIMGSFILIVLIITLWNYLRTKKLPPTDEGPVGDYRIDVDVGTHIVPLKGTIYYFTKLLNRENLFEYAKTLVDKPTEDDLGEIEEVLREHGFFYALRQGTRKLALISLYHPIEISPYFKSEEGTGLKIVHATGKIGPRRGGFQWATFEALDLSKHTLNPKDLSKFNKIGEFVVDIHEKVPLMTELAAEKQKIRVLQSKFSDVADELGKTRDEAAYWQHQAKRKGPTPAEEPSHITIPPIIKNWALPAGIIFIISYLLAPTILPQYHPTLVGGVFVLIGLALKKVLGK